MKTGPKRKVLVTKEELESLYLYEKKSARDIAILLNFGETVINNRLHEFGIPVRTRSESLLLAQANRTAEHKDNISKAHIGSGKFAGSNNPKWKGGVTMLNFETRLDRRYQNFRHRVLRFRGGTCEDCGKDLTVRCTTCGHKSDRHVHHKLDFAYHPDTRYSDENVKVLCDLCHDLYHKNKKGPVD